MKEREKNILEAATALFFRYGVKRTSMNDIAQEAGISRQTLYNAYRNKDEVLCSLIRQFGEEAHREIETGLADRETLDAQLDLVFDRIVLAAYDLLMTSPNAADILDGFNKISQAEIDTSYADLRALLVRLLRAHEAAILGNGLTVEELAGFVQCMLKASKHGATDRAHLESMLRVLRIATLKLAEAA